MADDARAIAEQVQWHFAACRYFDSPDSSVCTCARQERVEYAVTIIAAALHAAHQEGRDEAIKLMVDAALSARAEEHKANG
jgi:hypothetical protein